MNLSSFIFNNVSPTNVKISSDISNEALKIINEQNAAITSCKQAMLNAVKVAAVMAEAVKLVEDGVIDASEVSGFVEKSLSSGNVKFAMLDEDFYDSSPGQLVENRINSKASGTDPLTRTLREIGER